MGAEGRVEAGDPRVPGLLAAFDAQMRRGHLRRLGAGAHEEEDGQLSRSWGRVGRGFVIHPPLRGLDRGSLEALIARQCHFFGTLGLAFEWKTYGHDPVGLTDSLLAAGFVPEERESLLIGEVEKLAVDCPPPPGVTLREARGPGDTARMAAMMGAVWGQDLTQLGELFHMEAVANPGQVVLLVAEAGDEVVSTARLNLCSGTEFATLWAGSTLPGWRHRGIYRASVAHRARIARERGFRYLQVDASEASRPILERLGLLTVSSTTPYVWSPPEPLPD